MDIIRDFLDRVAAELGPETFTEQIAVGIESQLRRDWGGDRPYIPKAGEADLTKSSRRNIAVRQDFRKGESITFISRRFGISRAMVYKIING